MKIEHYSFGRLVVEGVAYTSDVIIHADGRVEDGWRRRRGHELVPEDLPEVLADAPRRLVVGTGAGGLMSVSTGFAEACRSRGINVEVLPTGDAVARFNELAEAGDEVAACFHLTC